MESKDALYQIDYVRFDTYDSETVRRISVEHISEPVAYDNLNTAIKRGLHDPKLGVSAYDKFTNCTLCGLDSDNCPGHFGHIDLAAPVYNPFYIKIIHRLLNSKCFNCHRLKMRNKEKSYIFMKFLLIKMGLLKEASEIQSIFYSSTAESSANIENKIIKFITTVIPSYEMTDINENGHERLGSIDTTNTEETAESKKLKKKEEDKEIKKLREKMKNQIKDSNMNQIDMILKNIEKIGKKKQLSDQNLNVQILLKETTTELWKMLKTSKCPNCNASNIKIKKQGHLKFFQVPLSKKEKNKMKKSGINMDKDALDEVSGYKANKIKKNTEQSDSESESEIKEEKKEDNHFKYLHALEVREHVRKLWEYDTHILSIIFGNIFPTDSNKYCIEIKSTGSDMFFLEAIIVPPNRFRPENKADGSVYLHQHTVLLTKIINLNNSIVDISLMNKKNNYKGKKEDLIQLIEEKSEKSINFKELISKWIELQETVNILYDSQKSSKKNDKKEGNGIRQILEKKEGMFRMKMMGKRVNYAGRSVISPDPNINANEVGVPLYIASKLTFPEPVTEFNVEHLRKLVMNGPRIYPGANFVENENGHKIALDLTKESYRIQLAKNLAPGKQTIYRHLMTGDILLVNRQPTLHKPSIMSHKAKVLPGEKTIRLHYSNCNCYNADFDGDEMNIHLLQDHIARQEAYTISNTDNQYIVPTSGKPIKGLIQDSIVSAVFLTMKDTFLKKEEYYQLVYSALDAPLRNKSIRKIVLQPPALVKPMRWTGKQVITTILKSLITSPKVDSLSQVCGINMNHSTKLSHKVWGSDHAIESTVTVRDNELLTGVLDKNHIGNSDYGIVHSFYEIYGSEMCGELISTFGRLFINYLQFFHGFTCGVDDLVLKDVFNYKRRRDIENILKKGLEGLCKHFKMNDMNLEFSNFSKRSVYTRKFNELDDYDFMPNEKEEIEKLIEEQKLSEKGFEHSNENNQRILSELRDKYYEKILKDDNAEGGIDIIVKSAINQTTSQSTESWLDKGLVKKFPKNLFSMMVLSGAKGSLVNHSQITCMLGQQELEGKRVPRMASGKTLPCFDSFDPNPRAGGFIADRFSTGIRPQEFFFHCMAGREGLIDTAVKTSRSGYLQRCLIKHLEQLVVSYDYTVRDTDGNIIQFLYGEDSIDVTNTKYLKDFNFLSSNLDAYIAKYKPERLKGKLDTKTLKREIDNISNNDTILSKYSPWNYVGAISEKVYDEMQSYINNNAKVFKNINKSHFVNTVHLKYLNSLIQPGESVGILAAQSIGEPSTQMTLNTFHLAGHGGVNMTLGIPRLREILMTSENNIKTPIMDIPFITSDRHIAEIIARNFERYNLINIIQSLEIVRSIVINTNNKMRRYSIEIKLEDLNKIKEYFLINSKSVKKMLKLSFIPFFAKLISKQLKNKFRNEILQTTVQANKEEEKEIQDNESDNEKPERKESVSEKSEEESENEGELYNTITDDNEENEIGETGETNEGDMDDCEIENKKEDYNVKSSTYKWEEGSIDEIDFDKKTSTFSFNLYIVYTQKNLLLKNILDQALKQIKFKSVNGVKNCRVIEKNGLFSLQIEGINFQEVIKHSDNFEINKIYTNDLGSILRIYGIEACRAAIVKEINNVFQSYHIAVDKRHLGLVADYITYQGTYRSFNRIGMEVSSSPFLKMCFETSMNYMIQSCVSKQTDNLKSASSSIVVGQVVKCGTGAFDIITN